MPALLVADDYPAEAARARGARPDDVRIDRIGRGPSAFPTEDAVPQRARDGLTGAADTRSAVGRSVLLVAVDVVGHERVSGDVVNLRVRQANAIPRAAAIQRDRHAAVVGDKLTRGIRGI